MTFELLHEIFTFTQLVQVNLSDALDCSIESRFYSDSMLNLSFSAGSETYSSAGARILGCC